MAVWQRDIVFGQEISDTLQSVPGILDVKVTADNSDFSKDSNPEQKIQQIEWLVKQALKVERED